MAAQKHPMETYHGIVRTPADAIKLFEACRLGLLPRVQRRLSEKERQAIRSGSVFVWDEREAGMRRWTDGKSWSASRVSGSFLTYREMEGKRGGGFNTLRRVTGKTPDSSGRGSDEDQDDGEPDGYRYKADGLMKQSFSITTSNGQHLHLISYYARPAPGEPELPQPTTDPTLRSVIPIKGMYPESSLSDNTPISAVSRVPVSQQHHHQQPPYGQHQPPPLSTGMPPHHQPYPPYNQAGYSWPPSPIATPPYNHHYTTSSSSYPQQQQQSLPPPPQQPQQGPYSRASPPPSYYSKQQLPLPQPLPPYGAAPSSMPYDRSPLPPPQTNGGMQQSRTTPPISSYSQQQMPGVSSQPPSNSPRSLYRQPPTILPPVSAPSSLSTGVSSYQTPPGSRSNLPPVSQGLLPALTTTSASNGGVSALTPPRPVSTSPTQSSNTYPQQQQQRSYPPYADSYGRGGSPAVGAGATNGTGNKASLSALLHPTPANSEPNSANAGSSNSAGSSPRHNMGIPPASGSNASSAPVSLVPQQFLQPAPSGEDSRALSRLDKKFCI